MRTLADLVTVQFDSVSTILYHVSPSANRDSIDEHGLDWRRMQGEGIAGSRAAEEEGVFLAVDRQEAYWFVEIGRNRHEALDVWEVTLDHDIDLDLGEDQFMGLPCGTIHGFFCWFEPVSRSHLRLIDRDLTERP